jgi:putative transposase
MAQGKTLAFACKEAEISEQSYYRWRKEYGRLPVEQARRLKDLERENARLRRFVADLSLEKQILKSGYAKDFTSSNSIAFLLEPIGGPDQPSGEQGIHITKGPIYFFLS